MKIKVIDLLNKIANGEEVPEKIKYNNREYNYIKSAKDYYDDGSIWLFYTHNALIINDEIEIIEDTPKKIEKINIGKNNHTHRLKRIEKKLNEIIDYLNKEEK